MAPTINPALSPMAARQYQLLSSEQFNNPDYELLYYAEVKRLLDFTIPITQEMQKPFHNIHQDIDQWFASLTPTDSRTMQHHDLELDQRYQIIYVLHTLFMSQTEPKKSDKDFKDHLCGSILCKQLKTN